MKLTATVLRFGDALSIALVSFHRVVASVPVAAAYLFLVRSMRASLIVLTLATGTLFAQTLGVERRQDLGFGFHRDVIAMQNPPGFFESVGHFEFLFYRQRKLCQLDECAVAPSGKAVVYQDGPSGNLFLFRPADGKPVPLTRKFPGLVDQFEWHEGEGFISAVVADSKEKRRTIRLQVPPKT
jgi:hypothetical protein